MNCLCVAAENCSPTFRPFIVIGMTVIELSGTLTLQDIAGRGGQRAVPPR